MAWNAPRAQGWRRRWGWPAALAMLALGGTVWLQAVRLPALRAEAQAQRQALAQALRRADAMASAQPGAAGKQTAAEQFQAAFPAASERHTRLLALLAQARELGVALPRTESRWQAGPLLASFDLSMPAQADYAALRAFIEAALAADPALSLDAVRVQRNSTEAGRVDAELRWALHSRGEAGAAAGPAGAAVGARP